MIIATIDRSSTFPHRPLPGQPFITFTMKHLELEAKLTPCAGMFYHWLLLKAPAGVQINFKLGDFRAWSAEHRNNNKPYSMKQIKRAVDELENLHLLTILDSDLKGIAFHPGEVIPLDLPNGQKSLANAFNVQPMPLMSTSEVSNPVNTSVLDPTDLNHRNSKTTTPKPTHHPVVCKNENNLKEEDSPTTIPTEPFVDQDQLDQQTDQPKTDSVQIQNLDQNTDRSDQANSNQDQSDQSKKPNKNSVQGKKKSSAAPPEVKILSFEQVDLLNECRRFIAPAPLNQNLRAIILDAEIQVVKDAIASAIEYRDRLETQGRRLSNPAGVLRQSITEEWQPKHIVVPPTFSTWFEKARSRGLVIASQMNKETGVIDCFTGEGWIPYPDLLERYPLDSL